MRLLSLVCILLSIAGTTNAAVTIAHTENATVGAFLSSSGAALTSGGVAVGIFTSTEPASFSGIASYADLVSAGFKEVRTFAGATQAGGFDLDNPAPVSGTMQNIALADLPAGTQLWLFAFDGGNYANGFTGSTEWAVIKDTVDHLSGADLSTKVLLLNTVAGGDIKFGTDNGNNVNMVGLAPEPSRALLLGIGALGFMMRRRRK